MVVAMEQVKHSPNQFNLYQVRKGDVYLVNLGSVQMRKNLQSGIRPAVVISNDIGNYYSPNVIVACLSSQIHKAKLPTHVMLDAKNCGLERDSFVMMEQIFTLSKSDLIHYITHLDESVMKKIDSAAMISMGISI